MRYQFSEALGTPCIATGSPTGYYVDTIPFPLGRFDIIDLDLDMYDHMIAILIYK